MKFTVCNKYEIHSPCHNFIAIDSGYRLTLTESVPRGLHGSTRSSLFSCLTHSTCSTYVPTVIKHTYTVSVCLCVYPSARLRSAEHSTNNSENGIRQQWREKQARSLIVATIRHVLAKQCSYTNISELWKEVLKRTCMLCGNAGEKSREISN